MTNEERRSGDVRSRGSDYTAARIGAASALVAVVVLLLVVDALSDTYTFDIQVLVALLGTIGGLLGIQVIASVRKDVK